MGTIFEELIRRFNEENNEEAGEHFTPRDVVELYGRCDLHACQGSDKMVHIFVMMGHVERWDANHS